MCEKPLYIKAFSTHVYETHYMKIMILSVRGNKSIKAVFDSQVVRLDVSAPRVVGLDVSVREWSGWMFFRILPRLCGRVGCGTIKTSYTDYRRRSYSFNRKLYTGFVLSLINLTVFLVSILSL